MASSIRSRKKILIVGGIILLFGARPAEEEPRQSEASPDCVIRQTDEHTLPTDFDADGIEDELDNCPSSMNDSQLDEDGDGFGDLCDNAPDTPNPDQLDLDGDGLGDVVDDDVDGDNRINERDNCPLVTNPYQKDKDNDGEGDACDPDDDGDGIPDADDPCPKLVGESTFATPGCIGDQDSDTVQDAFDNCEGIPNRDQADLDEDGLGDVCDPDIDNDQLVNHLDNAPSGFNPDQLDSDRDGIGDVSDERHCVVYCLAHPCIDPLELFQVGGAVGINEKDPSREGKLSLLLFANRTNIDIEYEWSITVRPNDSLAKIERPTGQGRASGDAIVVNQNPVPTFTPDQSGEYTFEVRAELLRASDRIISGGPKTATYSFRYNVEGVAPGCGCRSVRTR